MNLCHSVMEEDWQKDDQRQLVIKQLEKALEDYEGIGELAEKIEKECFRVAKTKEQYVSNLAAVLLDDRGPDKKHKCDICIFLENVAKEDWNLMAELDF